MQERKAYRDTCLLVDFTAEDFTRSKLLCHGKKWLVCSAVATARMKTGSTDSGCTHVLLLRNVHVPSLAPSSYAENRYSTMMHIHD